MANTVQDNEQALAALVIDHTPAVVGYIDNGLVYRFANQAYLEWFGKTREQVLHQPMREVLGPIYDANLPHTLAALAGSLQVFERCFRLPDGRSRCGLITYKPHIEQDGVRGFYVLVADVSPLKQAEQELELARQEARASLQRELAALRTHNATLSRLALVGQRITGSFDLDWIAGELCRQVAQLPGVVAPALYLVDTARQALQRQHPVEAVAPRWPARVALGAADSALLDAAAQRPVVCTEVDGHPSLRLYLPLRAAAKVSGMLVLVCTEPLGEDQVHVLQTIAAFGAIAIDNAHAYERVRAMQARLVTQEKMAALGHIVSGVAHGLNTPVGNCLLAASALAAAGEVLEARLRDAQLRRSELRSYLDDAAVVHTTLVRNLGVVADSINHFKKIAAGAGPAAPRRFALRRFLQELAAAMVGEVAAAGHTLDVEVEQGLWMTGCADSLAEVLRHLVNNAVQHGFAGRTAGRIRLRAAAADQHIVIEVSDDGSGIAGPDVARVFEPFFTTRMAGGHYGLGLSISYNIVTHRLGGDITLDSAAGTGTRVRLLLPRRPRATP